MKSWFFKGVMIALVTLFLNGCLLTKVVTVPMRVTGAVVSIIPVAGNTADAAIDEAADQIDKIPI